MRTWAFRALLMLFVLPSVLAMTGCDSCGGDKKQTECGPGTKKVTKGDGYECVPNTN